MTIDIDSVVRLEISKIVHGGWGLARLDGQVVFCSGVAPGDVVDARIRDVKKNHCFADLLDVITASPDRQPHVWPEAEWDRPPEMRPGSADFGHIVIDAQRRIKSEIFREALTRQGGFSASEVEWVTVQGILGRPDGLHWRTRETLHVGGGVAGPRASHSHTVVPVTTMPLAHQSIVDAGVHTASWDGHKTVRVVWSNSHGVIIHPDREPAIDITETVHGHHFSLDSRTFWQVHDSAPEVLWTAVIDAVSWGDIDPTATHLDLYGGVGLFARALLSELGEKGSVVSVESDPVASRCAAHNLSDYPMAVARGGDATEFLSHELSHAKDGATSPYRESVVVVDPPRAGLGTSAAATLIGLHPKQIVYVACDPVAFSRDARILREAGYHLSSLTALDLFPHTHHMEAVAGFRRSP